MGYVEFGDLAFTLSASAAFGIAAALFYTLLQTFVYSIERFIFIPRKVFLHSKTFSSIKSIKTSEKKGGSGNGKIKQFITDLTYVLTYGICYILLLYVTCDGVFRLYPLVITIAFCVLGRKYFARHAEHIFLRLLGFMYLIIETVLSSLVFAIRKFLSLTGKTVFNLVTFFKNTFPAKKSKK